MREVLTVILTFVVSGVIVMVGGAMVVQTENITLDIVPPAVNSTSLVSNIATDVGTALTTITSLLPLLGLAVIGGLTIFYLMGFMKGGGSL